VSPGEVDISADVDFTALAEAAIDASEGIEVYGPVEQGAWLTQMGIRERAQQLFAAVKDEAKKKEMELGWKRLIEGGPAGMGRIYKALAIVPESGGRRRPVGFGGHVVA
jgi:SAM-dependent MidA family methyltransferase